MIFELVRSGTLCELPETNFNNFCANLNLTEERKPYLFALFNRLIANNYPACLILNKEGNLAGEDFLSAIQTIAPRKKSGFQSLYVLICDFQAEDIPAISVEYENLLGFVNLTDPEKKAFTKEKRLRFYRTFIPNSKEWLSADAPDARGGDRKSSYSSLRSFQKDSAVISGKEVCRVLNLFLPNIITYPVFQRDIAELKVLDEQNRIATKNIRSSLAPLNIPDYLASLENLHNSELQTEEQSLVRCLTAVRERIGKGWIRFNYAYFQSLLKRSTRTDVRRALDEISDIANSDQPRQVYENILDIVLFIVRDKGWNPTFPAFSPDPKLPYETNRKRLLEIAVIALEKMCELNQKPRLPIINELQIVAKSLFKFEKPRMLQLYGQIYQLSTSLLEKHG